jgi:hypothetical protein
MPTRFYFPLNTPALVSPAFSANWTGTLPTNRYHMPTSKNDSSPITTGPTRSLSAGAGSTSLDRQYVSAGLNGQQVISGNCSGQLMVREFNAGDNVDRAILTLRVVSNDGSVVRGTPLSFGNYGPTLEFISNASLRNKTLADGDALTTVTGLDGDRLVLEIGYQNSTAGSTVEAAAKWGTNAADLPVNETQTTNGAGWFSITPNLKFKTTQFSLLD